MVDTQQFQYVRKVDSARLFGYSLQAELQVTRYRQNAETDWLPETHNPMLVYAWAETHFVRYLANTDR